MAVLRVEQPLQDRTPVTRSLAAAASQVSVAARARIMLGRTGILPATKEM